MDPIKQMLYPEADSTHPMPETNTEQIPVKRLKEIYERGDMQFLQWIPRGNHCEQMAPAINTALPWPLATFWAAACISGMRWKS
jgi:hypothetical protein